MHAVVVFTAEAHKCHLHARPSQMSQQRLKGLQYIINVRRRRSTHEPVACAGTGRRVVQNSFCDKHFRTRIRCVALNCAQGAFADGLA